MSSSKQKRQKLKLTRAERKAELERAKLLVGLKKAELKADLERIELLADLKKGTIIAADRSKVFSRSVLPRIPDYYRDAWFTCKDCGEQDFWTAKQQQRWYEEQGGEIEAIAIRCHACRHKEKLRRETARKIHLEGMARKRDAATNPAMNYVEFKTSIQRHLESHWNGATWQELRDALKLPYERPCPEWIHRLEKEIGLVRRKGYGRSLRWVLRSTTGPE
jgi:hypothetical protein